MSNETFVTIIGTVSKEPELKFTNSGTAVIKVTVVTNARKLNKQTNEWEKKPGKFWDCEAWNQGKALLAENIAETIKKGDTVIVYGELETREYKTQAGEQRRADQIRIEGIGKDLRWHQQPATVQGYANGNNDSSGAAWSPTPAPEKAINGWG